MSINKKLKEIKDFLESEKIGKRKCRFETNIKGQQNFGWERVFEKNNKSPFG